jgi:hypothetical protein
VDGAADGLVEEKALIMGIRAKGVQPSQQR